MMDFTIGIPQALLYYKQFPFWKTLFTELGAEVVVSEPTNSKIMELGLKNASSEVCLPVKVFFGHTLSLKNQCDYIFIPRVISVEKDTFTCPKFLGLPDMIKALPGAPSILSVNINAKKIDSTFREICRLAAPITKNRFRIFKAYQAAITAQQVFHAQKSKGVTPADLLGSANLKNNKSISPNEQEIKIGVVGHPYNLYDPYTSLNFLNRLQKDVEVRVPESIPKNVIEKEVATLSKPIFWSYEKEVVGSAMHWLKTKAVDGIIYLLAFACGPDSLIQVVIENEARKNPDVPMMSLVIDEHSGETGFLTRLEAFTDILKFKKMQGVAS